MIRRILCFFRFHTWSKWSKWHSYGIENYRFRTCFCCWRMQEKGR